MKAVAGVDVLTSALESDPVFRTVAVDIIKHKAERLGWTKDTELDIQENQYIEELEDGPISITQIAGVFEMKSE